MPTVRGFLNFASMRTVHGRVFSEWAFSADLLLPSPNSKVVVRRHIFVGVWRFRDGKSARFRRCELLRRFR